MLKIFNFIPFIVKTINNQSHNYYKNLLTEQRPQFLYKKQTQEYKDDDEQEAVLTLT